MRTSWLISFLFTFLLVSASGPDDSSSYPLRQRIGLQGEGDYVFSSFVDEIRQQYEAPERYFTHSAGSIFMRWDFSFTDPATRNYCPGGYQGIGASLLFFGNAHGAPLGSRSYIGSPVSLYVCQGAPIFHLSENLYLGYEWQFGPSLGWKPYSTENECFNLTSGSRVNAYMNVSIFLNWRVSERASLQGGLSLSHFSDGNTSWPNPGINMAGLRIGVNYDISPASPKDPPALPDTIKRGKIFYDISLWGALRKRVYKGGETPVLLNGRYACAGVGFAPMFYMGRWWRIGPSADLQWDESSDLKRNHVEGTQTDDIKFTRPLWTRQLSFGLSAHAELTMPIFSLNLGIGYNLTAPEENRGSYQNITLKTYLGSKFYLNVGYQLRNFHQQSSLMLGAGVTL